MGLEGQVEGIVLRVVAQEEVVEKEEGEVTATTADKGSTLAGVGGWGEGLQGSPHCQQCRHCRCCDAGRRAWLGQCARKCVAL